MREDDNEDEAPPQEAPSSDSDVGEDVVVTE